MYTYTLTLFKIKEENTKIKLFKHDYLWQGKTRVEGTGIESRLTWVYFILKVWL